ncbi:MAG: NAD(+)--dinitrogen-reductase ADP-D-ribosyltransferase [Methylococcaceae bacterium]|nr:NAD(+)--dinitrogen-reductase ADP-D-ribosyltransferase [Methylococcaceae bacterium]
MVGLPTHLLASTEFNDHPIALHIHGTCEANTGLFRMLDRCPDLARASSVFQDYMSLVFGFEEEQYRGTDALGRRRFHSSYLRLLQDWGFDSNNPQGAVLKGWVESRFGLFPTYHKAALEGLATPAWIGYVEEKMNNRYHNNCIFLQLDLLYEFCQWAVARFQIPAERHLLLFRGVDRLDELRLIEAGNTREGVVRLNNIVSFTNRRSTASEFGGYIIEARVPVVKLLFFNELLADHPLRGEAEYLVVGGDYRVRISS